MYLPNSNELCRDPFWVSILFIVQENSRRFKKIFPKDVAYTCKSDISHILDDRILYNGMKDIETVYDTCMIGRFYIYLYMNATNYFIACRPYRMPIGYKIVTDINILT